SEALAALLGKGASGLSASTIGRLKGRWQGDHAKWRARDLSGKRYVYIWAGGIHLEARLEDEQQWHPSADRGDAGAQEGARRFCRWRKGKCARLARPVARLEASRARRAAGTRHRRRRSWLLEGRRRSMAENAGAALLGAQDGERPRQAAEGRA